MTFAEPNITQPYELFTYANSVTSEAFGSMAVLACFVISVYVLSNEDTPKAFATASFITTIFAIFMRVIGVVGDLVTFICIVSLAGSALWLYNSGED